MRNQKCPEEVIDMILVEESLYSDNAFIAALSTDHAVRRLREAGINSMAAHHRLVYNHSLPLNSNLLDNNVFYRIIRLYRGPFEMILDDVLKRTYDN
jgi:hypothetical protein